MYSTVWALVLAAGEGRRFGGAKLLAPLRGRPVLAHVLKHVSRALKCGLLGGAIVVVPANDDRLTTLVLQAGGNPLPNDDPAAGLSRSLKLGLAALGDLPNVQAAIIILGDQPGLRLEVLELLMSTWRASGGPVIRPRYAEQPEEPGHPVLLDRSLWTHAGTLQGDIGLGLLVRSHPEWVITLDVPGHNLDIDTQADLAAFEEF